MNRWSCSRNSPVIGGWERIPQHLEGGARKRDQLGRGLVHPLENLLTRLCPRRGEDHQLHPPVSSDRPTLGEPPLFQPVNYPRCVRRVASPFVGERSHCPSPRDVERAERASVVWGQTHPGEHTPPLHACPHEEVEHAFPRFSCESGFVPGHSLKASSAAQGGSTMNTVLWLQ